jgi:hypothetical protein
MPTEDAREHRRLDETLRDLLALGAKIERELAVLKWMLTAALGLLAFLLEQTYTHH